MKDFPRTNEVWVTGDPRNGGPLLTFDGYYDEPCVRPSVGQDAQWKTVVEAFGKGITEAWSKPVREHRASGGQR